MVLFIICKVHLNILSSFVATFNYQNEALQFIMLNSNVKLVFKEIQADKKCCINVTTMIWEVINSQLKCTANLPSFDPLMQLPISFA